MASWRRAQPGPARPPLAGTRPRPPRAGGRRAPPLPRPGPGPALAPREPGGGELRTRLVQAYSDGGRGYHDLRHLSEVLEHVEDLMDADDPARGTVLLAAWFHDAVYDGRADDEEHSAELAEQELDGTPVA